MTSKRIKITTFVPTDSAEEIRRVLGEAGAGTIGEYTFCSFSVVGTGRFQPSENAAPAVGSKKALNTVAEERIEVVCERSRARSVIAAMKAAHPYEEVAFDLVSLIEEDEL